jgi:DHA1 family bicyclomycin/chloramphenicol resistance-like MFS transporter
MIGNAVSGRYTERWGTMKMLRLGTLLGVIGAGLQALVAVLGLMTHPVGLFAPQAIIALGNGFLLPSAIAAAVSVNPRAAGSAAGLTGFIQMSICAIMAQVSGMLVAGTGSSAPMVAMILANAIVAAALFAVVARKPQAF